MDAQTQVQTPLKKHLVSESLVSEMRRVDEATDKKSTALCVVEGPCMEFGKVNQNNRIYSRKLIEDRIINYKPVQEMIKNKCMLGEGGHPETRIDISYPEVGLCVEKIWIPDDSDHLVFGRFAILDTPVGRILKTLIDFGSKIGISARALAESKMEGNTEIMSETEYDLITFDAVPDPGFKCAHLERVKESINKQPVASMSTSDLKNNVAALNALKIPAFESRVHELAQELSKRTDDEAINAVLHSNGTLNKHTTGRRTESKKRSVEEVLSESNAKPIKQVGKESVTESLAVRTERGSEISDLETRYAEALADLEYYKSQHEMLKTELESALSTRDAVKQQNESLRHGIAKNLYQSRYLEKFSRLACEADDLSTRMESVLNRLGRLAKTVNEGNYHVSARTRTEIRSTKNESRSRVHSVESLMNADTDLHKDTVSLRRTPRRYSVESIVSNGNEDTKTPKNNDGRHGIKKSVNVREAIERWKQKAEASGIKRERIEKLVGNGRTQSDKSKTKAAPVVDDQTMERRIRSISNFERDVHDLAPKRGVFLTGKGK